MKKYFILKLDSYEGDGSSLTVDAGGSDGMFTCTGSYAALILARIKQTATRRAWPSPTSIRPRDMEV